MKYAIIQTGGKQYKVLEGQKVAVEKVAGESGQIIEFTNVLALGHGKDLQIGAGTLEKARVKGEIVGHGRERKVNVFKMKRRKGYSKRYGHRQPFTEILIQEIQG